MKTPHSLVHLELFVVALDIAHKLLIIPLVRSHSLLVEVEIQIGSEGKIIFEVRVLLEKVLDVCASANRADRWQERLTSRSIRKGSSVQRSRHAWHAYCRSWPPVRRIRVMRVRGAMREERRKNDGWPAWKEGQ